MQDIDFLIIDDDPAICRLVKRIADGCGFSAAASSDAEEFKTIYAANDIAVVAVDLSMPQQDGVEIFRFLAHSNCQASILIISGFDRRVIDSAWRLGEELGLKMAGVISKPIRLDEFRSLLATSMEARRRTGNSQQPDITAADIKDAVTRGELWLAFQPKIDLASGDLVGVEALARWQHPQFGAIPPSIFIPLAEKLDVIDWLTEWTIKTALRQWKSWSAAGVVIDIAVNISALSLGRLDFPDIVRSLCEELGVPPKHLIIELTEGATQSTVRLLDTMSRFRLKGVQISLDDYGTGYSSLAQLQQLPFNEIKIDRQFVEKADTAQDSRVIVKSIIDLAHNLGMTATAEGVETQSVLDLLVEFGCDQAQGYLIAKPMAGADLPAWLEGRTGTGEAPSRLAGSNI